MKTIFLAIIFTALGSLLFAQQVVVSYDFEQFNENETLLKVYLQSDESAPQIVRGINLSFVLPEGCVTVTSFESLFTESWTEYLEDAQLFKGLALSYGSWEYSQRWQYGNADPGLPATTEIEVPGTNEERLQVLELTLEGSCAEQLYLETQAENRLNQMGDEVMTPISWVVQHPRSEISLGDELSLHVYPIPSRKYVNLKFEGTRLDNYQYQLSSANGQLLQQGEILRAEVQPIVLDLSIYSQGVYFLKLKSAGFLKVETIKLIKL